MIRYASDVELIADLDTYKSTEDLFDLEIKTYDDLGTNIEGALQMATNRFMSNVHRTAVRSVVIIVGNSYRSGAYNDPSQSAAGFRESGGTIITIEYVQEHGLEVPYLRSLASPNYNLTNKKDDGTQLVANELRDLLCEANCFCRKNWQAYNLDKWNAPQGCCYYPVSIPAIQIGPCKLLDVTVISHATKMSSVEMRPHNYCENFPTMIVCEEIRAKVVIETSMKRIYEIQQFFC